MVAPQSRSAQNTRVNPSTNDNMVEPLTIQTQKLAKSLAHLKEKKRLLSSYGDVDMFSSLRPKIGKRYIDSLLEEKRQKVLQECRSKLVPLSIEEIDDKIVDTSKNLKETFKTLASSQISHKEYMKISCKAYNDELITSQKIRKGHNRKIDHFVQKLNVPLKEEAPIKPEKKNKHKELKRLRNIEKNRVKNAAKRQKKRDSVKIQIENIKRSNLVHNLSSKEVPDSAFAF